MADPENTTGGEMEEPRPALEDRSAFAVLQAMADRDDQKQDTHHVGNRGTGA